MSLIAETVILFSAQSEATRHRKRVAASSHAAQLGVKVTTPDALLEELWSVWGDARRIVSNNQRRLVVDALFMEQESWVRSPGAVDMVASFLSDYVVFLDEVFSSLHDAEFTVTDLQIIAFARRYKEALDEAGLVEPAFALLALEDKVRFDRMVVRTARSLPAFWQDFLSRVCDSLEVRDAQLLSDGASGNDDVLEASSFVGDSRKLVLLRPAGDSAMPQLILDELLVGGSAQRAIVASPDPRALFEQMKQPLADQGFVCTLEASGTIADTLFGQALRAAACILDTNAPQDSLIAAACTYIHSLYSCISHSYAEQLERNLLGDRMLDAEKVRELLMLSSRTFELFESLLEDAEAGIVIGAFDELLAGFDLPASKKESERSALSALRRFYDEADDLGVAPASFFEFALRSFVSLSETCVPADFAADELPAARSMLVLPPFAESSSNELQRVVFTTLEAAASYPEGCCDTVVLTDLDSVHYSGAEKHNTLTGFVERFDLPEPESTFEVLESVFEYCLRLPLHRIALGYASQSPSAEERFPAFFLESFLNECEARKWPIEEIPLGEARFDDLSRLSDPDQVEYINLARVKRGALPLADVRKLFDHAPDEQGIMRPVLSPSAIESYRDCPYRWFIQRKLRIEDVEEEFGPREQGSFAHSVLQHFYDAWLASGQHRVAEENISEARELFARIFDELAAAQYVETPGNRYVAATELEHEEIAQLKQRLMDNLEYHARLFSGYSVFGHEIELDEQEKLTYANALIRGRIDRIDTDDAGNFVVIDYKGSTGDAYNAGFDPANPEGISDIDKVQALIYAQALRRRDPSLHPKGAVYLSYKAKRPRDLIRGSLSELLDQDRMFTNKKSVVNASFETYLDQVEESLASTITRMEAGDIAPDPRNDRVCKYCPALYCEKRRNGSF